VAKEKASTAQRSHYHAQHSDRVAMHSDRTTMQAAMEKEMMSHMKEMAEQHRQNEEEMADKIATSMAQRNGADSEARQQEINQLQMQIKALSQTFEDDAVYKKLSYEVHRVSAAIMSISNQMEKASSFSKEAAVLREVGQTDPVVGAAMTQISESTARRGMKTLGQLQASFDELAPETRRAALMPEDGGPVWWGLAYVFDNLKFKQTGQVPGDSCDDILTRAQDHLRKGNLMSAVEEASVIEGLPGKVLNDWVGAAKERLKAEKAIVVLKAHAKCITAQVN